MTSKAEHYLKKCSHPRCTNKAVQANVCRRHGAPTKRCSEPECSNVPVKGGVCQRHGAKKKKCNYPTCTNICQKWGVCRKHGAEPTRCRQTNCSNKAVNGGVWCRHGAKLKKCNYSKCPNLSTKGGFCRRHFKNTTKSSQPTIWSENITRSSLSQRNGAYGNYTVSTQQQSEGLHETPLTLQDEEGAELMNVLCWDCFEEESDLKFQRALLPLMKKKIRDTTAELYEMPRLTREHEKDLSKFFDKSFVLESFLKI